MDAFSAAKAKMGAKSGGEAAAAAGVAAPQPAVPAPGPAALGSPAALEPAAYKLEDLETLATVGECGDEGNKGAAEVPVQPRPSPAGGGARTAGCPLPQRPVFCGFFLSASPSPLRSPSPLLSLFSRRATAGRCEGGWVPAVAVGARGRLAGTRRSLRAVGELRGAAGAAGAAGIARLRLRRRDLQQSEPVPGTGFGSSVR